MPPVTVGFGVVLAALGVFFYFPEQRSITALIPTFFGAAFIVLGLLGFKESLRKHVMHFAAMLGLIGFLFPAARAFPKLPRWFAGETTNLFADELLTSLSERHAVVEQSLMAIICLVFTALCVNSFIEARRARRTAEQAP